MKTVRIIRFSLFAVIMLAVVSQLSLRSLTAQETKQESCDKLFICLERFNRECYGTEFLDSYSPKLIDAFTSDVNHEDEMLSLDRLIAELNLNPKATGFIVIYGGRIIKYGEHQIRAGRMESYIKYRKFDRSRIKIVNGGFREKFEFELWISEIKNAFPPLSPTVEPEKVKFSGRMKPFGP